MRILELFTYNSIKLVLLTNTEISPVRPRFPHILTVYNLVLLAKTDILPEIWGLFHKYILEIFGWLSNTDISPEIWLSCIETCLKFGILAKTEISPFMVDGKCKTNTSNLVKLDKLAILPTKYSAYAISSPSRFVRSCLQVNLVN